MASDGIDSRLTAVQTETDDLLNQDVDTTRNMVQQVAEIEDTGAKVNAELYRQGEALDRTAATQSQIDSDLKESERKLTAIERWCGVCPCTGRSRSRQERRAQNSKYNDKNYKAGTQALPVSPGTQTSAAGSGRGDYGNYTGDAREDEINENLGLVQDGLARIKLQAELAGNQLDSNMEKEAHIKGRMDAENVRINAAEHRAAKAAGLTTSQPHYKLTSV